MSDNIVYINGTPIKHIGESLPACLAVNPDQALVEKLLEDMLVRVRRGEVVGIAVAMELDCGSVARTWAQAGNKVLLSAAVALLQSDYQNMLRGSYNGMAPV